MHKGNSKVSKGQQFISFKPKILPPIDYLSWSLKNIGKQTKKCSSSNYIDIQKNHQDINKQNQCLNKIICNPDHKQHNDSKPAKKKKLRTKTDIGNEVTEYLSNHAKHYYQCQEGENETKRKILTKVKSQQNLHNKHEFLNQNANHKNERKEIQLAKSDCKQRKDIKPQILNSRVNLKKNNHASQNGPQHNKNKIPIKNVPDPKKIQNQKIHESQTSIALQNPSNNSYKQQLNNPKKTKIQNKKIKIKESQTIQLKKSIQLNHIINNKSSNIGNNGSSIFIQTQNNINQHKLQVSNSVAQLVISPNNIANQNFNQYLTQLQQQNQKLHIELTGHINKCKQMQEKLHSTINGNKRLVQQLQSYEQKIKQKQIENKVKQKEQAYTQNKKHHNYTYKNVDKNEPKSPTNTNKMIYNKSDLTNYGSSLYRYKYQIYNISNINQSDQQPTYDHKKVHQQNNNNQHNSNPQIINHTTKQQVSVSGVNQKVQTLSPNNSNTHINTNHIIKSQPSINTSYTINNSSTSNITINNNSPKIIRLGKNREFCTRGCTTICNCLCQSSEVKYI